MSTYLRIGALAAMLALAACSGSQSGANTPNGDNGAGDGDGAGDGEEVIPITPQKPAPAALSDAERKELAGKCASIEPDIYEANKQALFALEGALAAGKKDADATKAGLQAGLEHLRDKKGDLGAPEHKRCLELFDKRTKLVLFEFEPAELAARSAVAACVKGAKAAAGKKSVSYDMGGSGDQMVAQGPFCPDDAPIPASLSELPYKSSSEDWESPAWNCLVFGLRGVQAFQIEYSAPIGANEFFCMARLIPRQGGAPIEYIKGGKVTAEGELKIGKIQERRMKR